MIRFISSTYAPIVWGFLMFTGALGLQAAYSLSPCPLCVVQRIEVLLTIVSYFLYLMIDSRQVSRVFKGISIIGSLAGLATAARHWWLQSTPSTGAGCGVSLDYVWENFPLSKVISFVFKGSGDCSQVDWKLFDLLTIPHLSLIGFGILGLLILQLSKKD